MFYRFMPIACCFLVAMTSSTYAGYDVSVNFGSGVHPTPHVVGSPTYSVNQTGVVTQSGPNNRSAYTSYQTGPNNRPSVQVTGNNRPRHWGPRVYWRFASGSVPNDAISGGYENGHPLYICKARYMGGIHPGKIVNGNCNISYGGREIVLDQYQVMQGNPSRYYWVQGVYGYIPANAVVGGYENGQPLYICHGRFLNGIHPGKVVKGNCDIAYGGRELYLRDYQVMVQR